MGDESTPGANRDWPDSLAKASHNSPPVTGRQRFSRSGLPAGRLSKRVLQAALALAILAIGAAFFAPRLSRPAEPARPAGRGATGGTAAAVDTLFIPEKVSCPLCRIDRAELVSITDDSYPEGALIDLGQSVLPLADGYLITGMNGIFFAGADGRIVERIGRAGAGPGEFRYVQYAVRQGAYVHFFDQGLGRIAQMEWKKRVVVRTARLPVNGITTQPLLLASGNYLIRGDRTGNGRVEPLHIVAPDGHVVRSFGAFATARRQDGDEIRRIAVGANGQIWVAYPYRYVIEERDTLGTVRRVIVRRPAWWNRGPDDPVGRGLAIAALHEDAAGRLWVIAKHPRFGAMKPCSPRCPLDDAGSEMWIEVLDVKAGTLVSSAHFKTPYEIWIAGTQYTYRSTLTSEDEPVIKLFGYEMEKPAGLRAKRK